MELWIRAEDHCADMGKPKKIHYFFLFMNQIGFRFILDLLTLGFRCSSKIPSGMAMPSFCNRFSNKRSVSNADSGILPPVWGSTCSRYIWRFWKTILAHSFRNWELGLSTDPHLPSYVYSLPHSSTGSSQWKISISIDFRFSWLSPLNKMPLNPNWSCIKFFFSLHSIYLQTKTNENSRLFSDFLPNYFTESKKKLFTNQIYMYN